MKRRLPIFLLAAAPVAAAAILAAAPISPGAACAASTVTGTHRTADRVTAGFVEGSPPLRVQEQNPIGHDTVGRGRGPFAPQGTDWDPIAPADGSAASGAWSQAVPCG